MAELCMSHLLVALLLAAFVYSVTATERGKFGFKGFLVRLRGLVLKSRPVQSDYFILSGVPRPKPLPHFDTDQAIARPYRPFRWEYHQNMCQWPFC